MAAFTFSDSDLISNPATIPFPEVGFNSPHSIRIAVVFPAPLAPRKPKISPLPTSNEMLSTAVKFPNFFVRFSTVITFIYLSVGEFHKAVFNSCFNFFYINFIVPFLLQPAPENLFCVNSIVNSNVMIVSEGKTGYDSVNLPQMPY